MSSQCHLYNKPRYFINPEIVNASKEKILESEQCLSVPGESGKVERHKWIELKYQTANGLKLEKQQQKFSGFSARVIQHEIDHLNGILFIDLLK